MPKYKKLSQMFTENFSPNAQEYYDPDKESEENKQSLSEQITDALKPKETKPLESKPEESPEPSAFEGLKNRLKEAGGAFLEQQRQKDADYKAGLFAQNERLNQVLKKPTMGPELPQETLPIEHEVAKQALGGFPVVGSIKSPTAAMANNLEEGVQSAKDVFSRIKQMMASRESAREIENAAEQELLRKIKSFPIKAIEPEQAAKLDQLVNSIKNPRVREAAYNHVTDLLKHSQKIAGQK